MPDGPEVIVTTSAIIAAASIAFGGILSLFLFHFYRNCGSKYITR